MPDDPGTDFDRLVADADPAMVVVTTATGDTQAGCLVGFHGQASIDPRRYAVWLSKANRTYRVALRADHLAVHFPSEDPDQAEVARLFGSLTGDDVDKFALVAHHPSPEGLPLLDAIDHRMVLRRVTVLDDGGDHVCFVGEPVHAAAPGRLDPLRLSGATDVEPGHPSEDA